MSPVTALIYLGIIALVLVIARYTEVLPAAVRITVQVVCLVLAAIVIIVFVRTLV
jgi:hypothetical protein